MCVCVCVCVCVCARARACVCVSVFVLIWFVRLTILSVNTSALSMEEVEAALKVLSMTRENFVLHGTGEVRGVWRRVTSCSGRSQP